MVQKSLLKQDSQLSILHPGEEKRERERLVMVRAKPSHLELIESRGVWGRGFLKGLYCLTRKKKKKTTDSDAPVNYASLGLKCISESLFLPDRFSFHPLVLVWSAQVNSVKTQQSERAGSHVEWTLTFPTKSQRRREEYIPLGCRSRFLQVLSYLRTVLWLFQNGGLLGRWGFHVLRRSFPLFRLWFWKKRVGRGGGETTADYVFRCF